MRNPEAKSESINTASTPEVVSHIHPFADYRHTILSEADQVIAALNEQPMKHPSPTETYVFDQLSTIGTFIGSVPQTRIDNPDCTAEVRRDIPFDERAIPLFQDIAKHALDTLGTPLTNGQISSSIPRIVSAITKL